MNFSFWFFFISFGLWALDFFILFYFLFCVYVCVRVSFTPIAVVMVLACSIATGMEILLDSIFLFFVQIGVISFFLWMPRCSKWKRLQDQFMRCTDKSSLSVVLVVMVLLSSFHSLFLKKMSRSPFLGMKGVHSTRLDIHRF